MHRRDLIKLAALGVALPSQLALGASQSSAPTKLKKNVILVTSDLGLFEKNYHDGAGQCKYINDYFSDFKGEMSYFDQLTEPGMPAGGHVAQPATFTGLVYAHKDKYADRRLISLDQHIADHTIQETRHRSINHSVGKGYHVSWNKFAQPMPSINGANQLYETFFGKVDEAKQRAAIRRERVILMGLTKNMRRQWKGTALEQELRASVEYKLERLEQQEKWLKTATPRLKKNFDANIDRAPLLTCEHNYRLIYDAVEKQQSKIFVYQFGGQGLTRDLPGITQGHHASSHHGYLSERVEQLEIIDGAVLSGLRGLLENLKTGGLYDDTIVLFSCGISDANKHSNRSVPAFLFGGGFNHNETISCVDNQNKRRYTSSSLMSSVLKQCGLKDVKFNGNSKVISELFKA